VESAAVVETVFTRKTFVESDTNTTESEFLLKKILATAFSVTAAAGTPFVKVAVRLVAVQERTASELADLKTAFAV
jgi:hypothetical protein